MLAKKTNSKQCDIFLDLVLKNIEKRVSTLKSLPQKKTHTHGTVKNKNNNDDDDDDDCNSSDNE